LKNFQEMYNIKAEVKSWYDYKNWTKWKK
jgi:hypothetical protein